jgi:hypothetical protein
MPPRSQLLEIHLNDHLAMATGTVELAKRVASEHAGSDLGQLAGRLLPRLEEDRDAIATTLTETGGRRDPLKEWGAWGAEKLGRLKLNGRLSGQSPLSALVELDGLSLGIEANAQLWRNLVGAADVLQLERARLDTATERAAGAREEVEALRAQVARSALLPGA